MKYFAGNDGGTGGIRAVVLDEAGNVCAKGYHECGVIMLRPGWAGQS